MKKKFYDLKPILSRGAQYNMIIGERSNGKTYALLMYALTEYVKNGKQTALIRRWREDFVGKRGQSMFEALVTNGEISRLTGGLWTGVYYYSGRWFLSCTDPDGERVTDEKPFAYGFSLSSMEHDKSTAYPNVSTVIFDEFLTRTQYLPDEFMLFMNTLSTIIRDRTDVKIFMLGNTVSKFCPYFREMGLTHIKTQKQGTIDIYKYGESKLQVAVEYCKGTEQGKPSDVFFSFDNPKLSMITGGAWEMAMYPHCPVKYTDADRIFEFFIKFDGEILHCEIINKEENVFVFVHPKTSPLKNEDRDLIFTQEYDPRPNFRRKLTKPTSLIEKKILTLFAQDKVFYSDNATGEIMIAYLKWCKNSE